VHQCHRILFKSGGGCQDCAPISVDRPEVRPDVAMPINEIHGPASDGIFIACVVAGYGGSVVGSGQAAARSVKAADAPWGHR
jgi:hypothetical protein